jgi:hypothetical protein
MRDTRDSSAIADDCCDDRMPVVKTFARLKVGWVQILRTMGKEIKTCSPIETFLRPIKSATPTYQP